MGKTRNTGDLVNIIVADGSDNVTLPNGLSLNGVSLPSSAAFNVPSTTKGALLPRMTQAQRLSIASPVQGLLIYQTDNIEGLYEYTSGGWRIINQTSSATPYTDYDNTITGLRNSSNKVFTTSFNFVSGSTRVFVNGLRYSLGASYDYQETGTNQITFANAPDNGDLLIIDYLKQ
jgi:hypothetical protein